MSKLALKKLSVKPNLGISFPFFLDFTVLKIKETVRGEIYILGFLEKNKIQAIFQNIVNCQILLVESIG